MPDPPTSPEDAQSAQDARRAMARAALAAGGVLVLHEDNHVLVVAKPAGLLSQAARAGDDTLVGRVASYRVAAEAKSGKAFVGLVHRLDRNTSGAVVLAKTSKAAGRLTEAFKRRDLHKRYLAVVTGRWGGARRLEHRLAPRPSGQRGVRVHPHGKPAVLDAWRLAPLDGATALGVSLGTGRKHQIRVQLAASGHALVGDRLYGRPPARGGASFGRPALHAWGIGFVHPVRREPVRVVAPLPADLRDLLARLGGDLRAAGPFDDLSDPVRL